MKLRQLEMIESVVRHGSLSRAAKELGLTQPAVSLQMKALAEELGVTLFEARGRGLEPTPSGRSLADRAGRILRLAEDARLAARLGPPGSTVVRVAASSTPGALLPVRIAAYRQAEPTTVVRLEVRNSRAVEERVASGEVDVGVIGGPRRDGALRSEHWCDDDLVLVVAPGHPLARRRSLQPRHLAGEQLLVRESGSATRATIEAAFLRANLALPDVQELGDTEALKHAVAAGLGVAFVSPFSVGPELEAGRLRALRVRGLSLGRPFSILSRGPEEPPVARFLAFLRARRPSRPSFRGR